MDEEIKKQLDDQQKKIDQIYISVEKTRKYFLWTMIITVALVVIPMIGLIFTIPSFLNIYTNPQSVGL